MRCLLTLALVFCAAFCLKADDATLRRELDRAYSSWRDAIVTRSLSGWQQSTAAYRQVTTRNLIVSQLQPFPSALFALPMRPPETSLLRFLKAEAKGGTATLAYFGKVDIGVADPSQIPENILILKFLKDPSGWKFDTTRLVNLESAPDVRSSLRNGGSSGFLNGPEFAPSGVVPPVPQNCPIPDRIGVLQIASIGYETKATINGFDIATIENNAEEHIIVGGLKNGENPLKLNIKELPVPEGVNRVLDVSAIVLTGSEKRPSIKVFSWKPETKKPAETENLMIHVSKITMRE